MPVIFIGCVKSKRRGTYQAKDLYISPLFRYSYRLAVRSGGDIFILSAKYGLVRPEAVICSYEETLVGKTSQVKQEWARKVLGQMRAERIVGSPAVWLCGKNYYENLIGYFPESKIPLKGLSMGNRLKWMKERV